MRKADRIHKELINKILEEGCWDENPRPKYKDGTPAFSKFITQVFEEYDISKGELPITNLRPIATNNGIKETFWIYKEQTSELSILRDKYGIEWWDSWDIGDGTIGQRYGATVRRYDMVNELIEGLKNDPFGRSHIISLLQAHDLKETEGLKPCAFQIMCSVRNVAGEKYLDLTLTQRSSDYVVAGHINMIQYVALLMMLAHECGYKVGKFARFTQNLHIYDRHLSQAREILNRECSDREPVLKLNAEGKTFYEIEASDFTLENYEPTKPQLKFDLGI